MKSFQLFNEDAEEAKQRQLKSLEDLERRRERAQTKSKQIAGTFKKRTKKRLKAIKAKHQQMELNYQQQKEKNK